jgi:transcriptional regulator with XRE-family HTH domain
LIAECLDIVSFYDTLFRMDEQTIGRNIRKLRIKTGSTLTAMAKKAKITKSTLSKIETGQISPPISTLLRISKAMNLPLVVFFEDEKCQPAYILTRKGSGKIVPLDGTKFGYSYEGLALGKQDKYVEPFLLTINSSDPSGIFQHDGQELIYMLSGKMEFTIGEDKLILNAGDTLYFDSSCVHKTRIIGKRTVKFLCVFVQEMYRNAKEGKRK